MKKVEPVKHILKRIYGDAKGSLAFEKILPLIENFSVFKSEKQDYFSQKDVVLIACLRESPSAAGAEDCLSIVSFSPYGLSPIRCGLCFINWARVTMTTRVIKPRII